MTDSFPNAVPASARLRSGTAARLAGLPVATLRVWERRYGVVAAPKTATGQRLYSGHDVQRLRLIKQLTAGGHAIGTIATLDLPALQALAAGAAGAAVEAAPDAALSRLIVVGRAAAHKLRAVGVIAQAVHDDLEHAAAAGGSAAALLVQLSSLQPATTGRVLALRDRLGAGTLLVLYAFGAEAVADALRDAGAMVRREPVGGRELAALLGAARPPLGAAAAPSSPLVEPRRYSDEALAGLAELPSSLACECPRHVAEIVMQLAGFERYSAECTTRSPADAALHRHLSGVAGAARTLFERALERLVAEEGLRLDRAAEPAA